MLHIQITAIILKERMIPKPMKQHLNHRVRANHRAAEAKTILINIEETLTNQEAETMTTVGSSTLNSLKLKAARNCFKRQQDLLYQRMSHKHFLQGATAAAARKSPCAGDPEATLRTTPEILLELTPGNFHALQKQLITTRVIPSTARPLLALGPPPRKSGISTMRKEVMMRLPRGRG